MKLIIAEKPSVAQAIAKVLGKMKRQNGYLENESFIVTWCIGHLVSLATTEVYDERYKKWRQADLPIIPDPFQYQVLKGKEKQFSVVSELMEDERVKSIVCATDAGREGELIFRLAYEQVKCKKPMERLWVSSMETSAISEGLANLQPSCEYDNLYQAALCRAQADWLVGINATRLFSTLYNAKLNIGRVQTPTLAMLVERERAIETFVSMPYYTVAVTLDQHSFVSRKIDSKEDATAIQQACEKMPIAVESIVINKKTNNPPKLYDLTTLQREANRTFNLTAKQTLDTVQVLYEKKLVTYPRTDSQYITEDMEKTALSLIPVIIDCLPVQHGVSHLPDVARIMDNTKVSDHHAILVTKEVAKLDVATLTKAEQNILMLIANRLLIATALPYLYEEQVVTLQCENELFVLKQKQVLEKGWKSFLEIEDSSLENKLDLVEGQTMEYLPTNVQEHLTTAPKSFTEDTMLSAMERASAEESEDTADMEHKGLGTPATRAGIIERLVQGEFVERKGKKMLPTQKGSTLIQVVPDVLKSAALTAEWEYALAQIEKGDTSADQFMSAIQMFVAQLIADNQEKNMDVASLFQEEKESIGTCPRCQSEVQEFDKAFGCVNTECGFVMWKNNKFFTSKKKELTKRMAKTLLEKGKCKVTKLYSEKTGKTYDANVVLDDTGDKYVNFKLEFINKK
ncbi:type IA DNA topoisomerase [Listeria grandensis]|uniref:type IA DNA topoisomerase n=1 Tax=Listeria grandensis TaxID=1494963 RepID=UPI00164E6FEC|nr:type IA DNA topoisomerase [Listeria grandensis]MBC6314056.1 DNA topoisomerase 3 [Listeria grandensis]